MILKQKQPSPELKKLLTTLFNAGGVVDFVLFDLPTGTVLSQEDLHRSAAESTLHVLINEANSRYVTEFSYQIEKATPRPISVTDFYGCFYDAKNQGIVDLRRSAHTIDDGLAYKFAYPPYTLQLLWNEVEQLFVDVSELLFNGYRNGLDIIQWTTDWSSYYDAGNQYWDTSLWTIHNTTQNFIVGATAAATD